MALSLGYKVDRVMLKKHSYFPRGYAESAEMDRVIKKGLYDLFQGNSTIPISSKEDKSDSPLG